MSNRTVILAVITMTFVGTIATGLTLLFKDQTKEAMEIFGGGALVAMAVLFLGGFFFIEE